MFTKEVAHTLAFGDARQLHRANEALRQVVERLPESRAAAHAAVALGTPMARDGKVLEVDRNRSEVVDVVTASPTEARELLSAALGDFDRAADSLGHIAIAQQTHQLAAVLAADGATSARDDLLQSLADALARRGVLPGVAALRQR